METEKEDFATWFARRKHLFKGNLEEFIPGVSKKERIDFWDKLTPAQKHAFSIGSKEELRNVQKSEKLKHTQNTPEGQNTPHQGTPQTTPGSASATMFNWSTDNDKQEVYSNEQLVAKLSSREFKLFNTLKKRVDKFVKRETLETCWGDNKPSYASFVTDAMNGLETTLKKGLRNKENVIERKKDGKVITAYKLLP